MKREAKQSLALAAAAMVAGLGGKLMLEDCYRATVYQGGEYIQVAKCIPAGEELQAHAGGPVVEERPVLWTAEGVSKTFECACSSGKDCTVDGKPAPVGNTLAAETWSGPGCVRKSCVELMGKTSWPRECPQ